jgi:hypothetical protein
MPDVTPYSNRLLSHLSSDDFALLEPDLTRVVLPLRKRLEAPRRSIDQVYFPESGFVSVVADGGVGRIEVGLIAREGMTGLAVVMGTDRTPNETFVQNAGEGSKIASASPPACDRAKPVPPSVLPAVCPYLPASSDAYGQGKRPQQARRALGALAPDGA